MFQVGKKYYSPDSTAPVECVHVSTSRNGNVYVTMEFTDGSVATRATKSGVDFISWDGYVEYKEPIRHVRYINVYTVYKTRKEADAGAGPDRIACKRVEFTEGEWDE